ncbi:glyoxal reductase-like isoform X2 [Lycorma delicatula]|uniref:glyoxal reductase-like isoform X2 n=1 Tax=Lycorma delicatula TaxID=130591 RepID=UPI003F5155E6
MDSYVGVKRVLQTPGRVIEKTFTLSSGAKLPIVGLGTYRIRGEQLIYNVLDAALAAGYRSIDTATVYENEADIGNALQKLLPKYNLKREDIFITSKLAPFDQGGHRVVKAVSRSLEKLKLDYLDLYLIHWPGVANIDVSDKRNAELRFESWVELEKIHYHGEGTLKSIGVSNYTAQHLEELLDVCDVPPVINQIEFHPHYRQNDNLYKLCEKSNVLLQAYSPLGGSNSAYVLDEHPVNHVADIYQKTSAQVLLRWALQCGYAIIPKSVNPGRIVDNCDLDFTLSKEHFKMISNISYRKKYAWDPLPVM